MPDNSPLRDRAAIVGIGATEFSVDSGRILCDHFTPFVLMQLEAFGFCGRGEAKDFQKSGGIEVGGALPVDTNGGQLGEAYIHGMNGLAEAVRQIRGTSTNPVADVDHVLVTGGPGIPSSGAILGRD